MRQSTRRSRRFGLAAAVMLVPFLAACVARSPDGPPVPATTPTTGQEEVTAPVTADAALEAEYARQRDELVARGVAGMGVADPHVIDAMAAVPRHLFVPERYRDQAYANHPLPIGHGQTISQPYIVALMTEALDLGPDDAVLEVGTGSGYQAAVLAELVDHVFSIEIIDALAERAELALADAGYENVEIRHADGYSGWPEHGPYDAIIVTAAPDHVPPPLKTQLADGGRLVIPVGPVGGYQELWLVERDGDTFNTTSLGGVSFVPFTREER